MELKSAFAATLRRLRNARGLTQEDFSILSSRTNISVLERAMSIPTLAKLEQLCSVLNIHPLTMMAICYATKEDVTIDVLLDQVRVELTALEHDVG